MSHLKFSLPRLLEQRAHEIIVVDYDCPNSTAEWVKANAPEAIVIKEYDNSGFSLSIARNVGARQATGNWLCFVDADTLASEGWMHWLQKNVRKGHYYVAPAGAHKDLTGVMVCSKEEFELAGRYDEAIRGWGGEDIDLRYRLRKIGTHQKTIQSSYLSCIPHDDTIRDGVSESTDKAVLQLRAYLYVRAKEAINSACGGLDECCRRELLAQMKSIAVEDCHRKAKDVFPIKFYRYCPACANRKSNNSLLTLKRTRRLFGGKRFVLTEVAAWKNGRYSP